MLMLTGGYFNINICNKLPHFFFSSEDLSIMKTSHLHCFDLLISVNVN